jgi:hypothetical protein
MSERDGLFRPEALEYRARGRAAPGGVLRLGARWLRWSYWLLVALVVAAVVLAVALPTWESTTGPAVVDVRRGTFSALLPAVVAAELPKARSVRLDLPSGAVRVKVLRAKPVEARTRVDGLPAPEQPAILLSGRLMRTPAAAGADSSRLETRMTVVLRSERVGAVVVRQVKDMIGNGGAGA